jgi:hypothetical protein
MDFQNYIEFPSSTVAILATMQTRWPSGGGFGNIRFESGGRQNRRAIAIANRRRACILMRERKISPGMKPAKKRKDKHLNYLLPGQGGSAHRRKQWFILQWSILTALLVAAVLAAIIYWLNRPKMF